MSGKSIFVLGIIIIVTCIVSDWAFGKFFTWLGKLILKRKERKKNKYVSYVKPLISDSDIVPADELFEKE